MAKVRKAKAGEDAPLGVTLGGTVITEELAACVIRPPSSVATSDVHL